MLPGASPNYIFPMLTAAYYSVANIEQFQRLSFRSLYWIGNGKGQPVVDPAMSLAALPVYSKNNSVVTITLGNYKWSDGTPVTTRDVAFWINMLKANKSQFAAYIPGEFPDNLKSYKVVNAKTIVLTLTGSFNPTWFTYNQLSQITPLPTQVMDKTSASGKVGDYDQTPSGAKAVFNFLTAQAKDITTYGTNPLWKTVDGPWTLVNYQSGGYSKFQANPNYAGPTKPKLKYFVEQPYTSETAELNVLRSGSTIDYGYLPTQESSQASELANQGYTTSPWLSWGTTFFLMNFHNPKTGPLIAQPYIRQAMQSLIDQKTFVSGPLKGYGTTNYGPVPAKPANPYSDAYEAKGPWPYAPATAIKLLKAHGWTVTPNGVSTCASPGTGATQCGKGIAAGDQAELLAAVRQRHRVRHPGDAGAEVGLLPGRHPGQPVRAAVQLDHQPAHPVHAGAVLVLVGDAQLRRRLDLRREPVPDRRPDLRRPARAPTPATTPTRRPTS